MQKVILRLFSAVLLFPFLISCLSLGISPPQSISLPDPVMAKAVDANNKPLEPTTVFKTTDKRMYATICPQGPDHIHLGARWYNGNTLITDQTLDLFNQQCGSWYLESPPGGSFPVGDYRIEIYLVKSADRIVNFKVIE